MLWDLQAVYSRFEEMIIWGAGYHPSQNRGGRLTAGRLIIFPDRPELARIAALCAPWSARPEAAESQPRSAGPLSGRSRLSGSPDAGESRYDWNACAYARGCRIKEGKLGISSHGTYLHDRGDVVCAGGAVGVLNSAGPRSL